MEVFPKERLPSRRVAWPSGTPDSARIGLARTQCYGTCPDYEVEIRADGSATYVGRSFDVIEGRHEFTIPKQEVYRLIDQFRKADFWSLDDAYVSEVTDNPSFYVSLSYGGSRKIVKDYSGLRVGMPDALNDLELAIDRAADTGRFTRGNERTVEGLRAEKWDFHSADATMAVSRAIRFKRPDVARALVAAGVPVSTRPRPEAQYFEAGLPVEVAAETGDLGLVRELVGAGAFRLGPPDTVEATLRGAARAGNAEIAEEALRAHPRIDAPDQDGVTALMIAASSAELVRLDGARNSQDGHAAVVRRLLAAGANPNATDASGQCALHRASTAEIAQALIAAHANLEVRDHEGRTPLLANTDEDVVLTLLAAGANPTARTGAVSLEEQADLYDWKRVRALLRRAKPKPGIR